MKPPTDANEEGNVETADIPSTDEAENMIDLAGLQAKLVRFTNVEESEEGERLYDLNIIDLPSRWINLIIDLTTEQTSPKTLILSAARKAQKKR